MNVDLKVVSFRHRGNIYRRALAKITETYPPDTEAGKLAADAIAEGDKFDVPNRFAHPQPGHPR